MNITRKDFKYRDIQERIRDYKNIYLDYTEDFIKSQASRCQDCGIPFCHGFGCPLSNLIPDFNDAVYKGQWKDALNILHSTSNFPEITGIVCPALCEEACTLNFGMEPVTIKNIELAIIEKGFENGWILPEPPKKRTGKKIAVIGSGPAGLVIAQNLNRQGHTVVVFEKDDRIGGFLRYGIPDFKMEKYIIDRRIEQMKMEGIEFNTDVNAGDDISVNLLKKSYDVIVLTVGSREPRDLLLEGRGFNGIHFAVEYLKQSNKSVAKDEIPHSELITAKNKKVIVIGGGDTGADCIGTARRQGAKEIYQLEILPKPPESRSSDTPWPMYAKKLRNSSSHLEGCERRWNILTKKFFGENINAKGILGVSVEWFEKDNKMDFKEIPGTEFSLNADLILLAMGFVHPEHSKLLLDMGVEFDIKGNIKTDSFGYGMTSVERVFAAGDAVRGASLVVWAFAHARDLSNVINDYLK
ncbi:MAG: glutamate synthase subunit beta [Spirochaetes bacterium]|nr:glutamate synthase subunit beta [Spirochaetota bacterium]